MSSTTTWSSTLDSSKGRNMTRHFDESPPGRMNFREIAAEVRKRSGNRTKPSDIQIVNAIGMTGTGSAVGGRHSLVSRKAFVTTCAWDED